MWEVSSWKEVVMPGIAGGLALGESRSSVDERMDRRASEKESENMELRLRLRGADISAMVEARPGVRWRSCEGPGDAVGRSRDMAEAQLDVSR